MIDWFESICRDARRRVSRSELALRLLGLKKEVGTATEPGLLVIQIDGLARAQMERSMARGRLPFLRWLMEREHYDKRTFYSGLPSSTPGVQAELFYGKKTAVPSFSFVDRKTKRVMRMFTQDSAVQVEEKLQGEAEGVLKGGSSYANIYKGGARESHYCAPDLGWGEAVRPPALWRVVALTALHFWSVVRLLMLGIIEFIIALVDFVRGLTEGQDLWKELKFIPTRIAICILLRELVVVGAGVDLARGLPVIHVNFIGYDEQAHRRGPSSAFAHWTLLGIDDAIKRLYRAAMRSPNRDYSVWIFSDHGQEETASYPDVVGSPLAEMVEAVFRKPGEAAASVIEREAGVQTSRAGWSGLPRGQKRRSAKPAPLAEDRKVVVTAMGPVGHIYCKGNFTDEEKAKWADALVTDAKIPLVLYRTGDGAVAGVSAGCGPVKLPEDSGKVLGEDHPLLDEVAEDLPALVTHPDAGDFVVLGWRRGERPMSFPVENGAHAGPGPNETRGFLLLPPGTPVEQAKRRCMRPREMRAAILHHLKRKRFSPHVRSAQQVRDPDTVKIMTYNIHRCLGLDAKISPERIARVIAQQQPDIVALQEVDVGRQRTFSVDQAKVIAELLLMKYHFYPAHEIEDEKYGLAVLSHYPMNLVKSGSLPGLDDLPDLEPRGAQWIRVTCGDRNIHLVNTHLGLRGRERRRQVEAILGDKWLGGLGEDEPLVICGDLNAIPSSFVHRTISTKFSDVQHVLANHRPLRTFYGRYPLSRIDHIFISDHFEARRVRVARTSLTRVASDHLPLYTEVTLKKGPPANPDLEESTGKRHA